MVEDKKYQVMTTRRFRNHLSKIFRYLNRNRSEQTAHKVRKGLLDAASSLEKQPTAYPIERSISDKNNVFRYILKWTYKLVFTVKEEGEQVIMNGIFHTKQDPDKLKDMFDDE